MTRRRLCLRVLTLALFVLCVSTLSLARPGGGQTYSGSSSSSSSSSSHSSGSGFSSGSGSSSSDGGGEAIGALIGLCFEYPPLGILVLGILVAVALIKKREDQTSRDGWDSSGLRLKEQMEQAGRELEQARKRASGQSELRTALEGIRGNDPEFSLVLFEDFLYALFAETHVARGAGTLDRLAPWLSESVRAGLASEKPQAVRDIVVGAFRYVEVIGVKDADDPRVRVVVELEANLSEGERRLYVKERWKLSRKKTARSKPPAKTRVFTCPSCGAPLEALRGRECSYCKKTVDGGDFDWVVRGWQSLAREEREPELGGYAEEQGTDLPTVVDPKAQSRWEALCRENEGVTWPALLSRMDQVFLNVTKGWNERKPLGFRAYVSDGAFQSLCYWIDAYERQGLRNVNDEARITSAKLARVVTDAHYHSVTVRIFASGCDYTVDASGKLIGGSKTEPRRYSEYWTLIRGVAKLQTRGSEKDCPSCGAPLEIEMTGQCKHCGAKVASGDFDWVLSRIEQDDSY